MVSLIPSLATVIINTDFSEQPMLRAVKRSRRDMEMALRPLGKMERGSYGMIRFSRRKLSDDDFHICISKRDELVIEAGNNLGIIYGFCYLSRKYLGILPFWFWNDQAIEKKQAVCVADFTYISEPFPIKCRGWFINGEVLLDHWNGGVDSEYPWGMAFETLLRRGSNLVISGMDKNARKYEELASAMGLWISHHHSEPLGAEQFSRVYPDKTPSYKNHPLTFYKLWEETVKHQVDKRVVWNIGYRGQGDIPIWVKDPSFDTPEKRGKILGSIMKQQSNLMKQHVNSPVFSVSFDDEIMELYRQGLLTLPENVVLIWADNEYGKMVSRRQGADNPRTPSLPDIIMGALGHGTNYRVSYYGLQAANHIIMLPSSTELVGKELQEAYDNGIHDMWLIDSSNIKPHVFVLDFTANQWGGSRESMEEHLRRYLEEYFPACVTPSKDTTLRDKTETCFRGYHEMALVYEEFGDEHAGEQFYNYVTRELACCWVKDSKTPCGNLSWYTKEETLDDQIQWYRTFCEGGIPGYANLLERYEELAAGAGQLWEDSLLLQVRIYYNCMKRAVEFCRAFEEYRKEEYYNCFYLLGQSADYYCVAVEAMDHCSHDKQKGFYKNECLTDVKETIYLLRRVMFYIRTLGDDPYFYLWQRQVSYAPEDSHTILITNKENHMTDDELYEAMKTRGEETEPQ